MAEKTDELKDNGDIGTIRAEMIHTRAEMGQTIDTLRTRLAPSHLIAHAKHSVAEATVGRVKHLAETTRHELAESPRVRCTTGAIVFVVAGLIARLVTQRIQSRRISARRVS